MTREYNVLSTAFGLQPNQPSKPIAGNDGVYIVQLDSAPSVAPVGNMENLKRQTSSKMLQSLGRFGTQGALIEALKKAADVDDNREQFF